MKYEVILFDADETLFDFKKSEKEAFKNAQIPFEADSDYKNMIIKALKESQKDGNILLVTGSFYLVAEFLHLVYHL